MNPYLMPAIETGPTIVQRLLAKIPADKLDTAMEPDRFTPREVIAHLADWEPIMRGRLEGGQRQPGMTVEVYDEGEMAITGGYTKRDPLSECERFARERALTAAFLRTLSPEAWKITVEHPERGTLSLEDQANLLLGHDLYHIEQLSASLP